MLQITDAEARVMEVLWAAGAPLSAEEIAAGLRGPQRWQLATIKTLVNRLLNKGAIRARKDGRRYLYSPRLRRDLREQEDLCAAVFGLHVGHLNLHAGKVTAVDVEPKQVSKVVADGLFEDRPKSLLGQTHFLSLRLISLQRCEEVPIVVGRHPKHVIHVRPFQRE